jgi:hypothetical protein
VAVLERLTALWTWRPLGLACRCVLAAAFLMAAVSKLTDLSGFREFLTEHSGLSEGVAVPLAAWLPWFELTTGLCLVFGCAVREAALLLLLLLVPLSYFTLTLPDDSPCGCLVFPSLLPDDSRWWPLVRNLLLFACGLRVVCQTDGRMPCLERGADIPASPTAG